MTTDGAGNWVAVWQSTENLGGAIGTDQDILLARSTDNGATWTAPAVLNTNAATDSGEDQAPQVTTDGGGNWVAAWYSNENLGGGFGGDDDILYATCPRLDTDCDWDPDATDPDDDNDAWNDDQEAYIGTDPRDNCTDEPGDNDAWPPDSAGPTGCGAPDTTVNILDILMYKPVLHTSCTNP